MIVYVWQRLVTYVVLITYVSATVSPVFAGEDDTIDSSNLAAPATQTISHAYINPLLFRDKGISFTGNTYPTIAITLQPDAQNEQQYLLGTAENGVAGKSYALTNTSRAYSYTWGEIRASAVDGLIIDSLEPNYNYVFNVGGNLSFYGATATQGYIDIVKARHVHNAKQLKAGQGLNMRAGSLDNSQAVIEGGDIFLTLGRKRNYGRANISLDNSHGSIVGQHSLNIRAKAEILNSSGQCLSAFGAATVLSLESIYNNNGMIGADKTATVIAAGQLVNNRSRLFANSDLVISAGKVRDRISCYTAPKQIDITGGRVFIDKHSRFYKHSQNTPNHTSTINAANLVINAGLTHVFAPLLLNNLKITSQDCLGLYSKVHTRSNLELHSDSGTIYYQPLALTANDILSLTAGSNLSLTQPLRTPGQLSVTLLADATEPLKVLTNLHATQGLSIDAGNNRLEIGRQTGSPPQLQSDATLDLGGQAVDILNAGIAATGKITLAAATTLKVGRSVLVYQSGKWYYRGNGTFIATLDILDVYSQSTELMLVELMGVNGLDITAPQQLLNNGSKIHSNGNGRLQTARLINQAVIYDANAYRARGNNIVNYGRDCLHTIARASIHFGGALEFVDLQSGVNIASDLYAGGGFSGNVNKIVQRNINFVVPAPPPALPEPVRLFTLAEQEIIFLSGMVREDFLVKIIQQRQHIQHLHAVYNAAMQALPHSARVQINYDVITTHGSLPPQAALTPLVPSSLRANFNTGSVLNITDTAVLRLYGLIQAPRVVLDFNHLIVGDSYTYLGLTALRQRQLGFKAVQNLSAYVQPSQMQILDETDAQALIVPPTPLRNLRLYPDVTLITPTGFQANNDGLPRLYHPLFEMEAIIAALSDNLGRGFLDAQTRTPDQIYARLLDNGLKLRDGTSSLPAPISNNSNQLAVLTTNPNVNFDEPALVYTVTPGHKTRMLEAHIVWPKKWQQAMAKARQITAGVSADVGHYSGNSLAVYGQLDSSQQGVYDVSHIGVHGHLPTLLTHSTALINSPVAYQPRPRGMITGGQHQFSFATFNNNLGLVETTHNWFLGKRLLSTGVLNLWGTTFWDVENTAIVRLQETRYQWVTETSTSSKYCGLRKKKRERQYLAATQHSYPLEVSGLFQTGQLIKGAPGPDQSWFPERQVTSDALSPVKLFTMKGAHLNVGTGGIDARLRGDLLMLPNIDSSLEAYHSSKRNTFGKCSVSGAIQVNHLIRPATISQGPIKYTIGGSADLTAALIQTSSTQRRALQIAATNMHLRAQILDQVMPPEVNVRKTMQSVSQIQYQQGFPATVSAPSSDIVLTIEQRLDGTAPVFHGQSLDTNAGEIDFDINRLLCKRQTQLSGLNGLSYIKQQTNEVYESAQQPLYLVDDISLITHHGDNRQVAPLFGRSNSVTLGAMGGQVLLYDAKLTQSITTTTRSVSITTPGNNLLGKLLAGDSLDKALIAADPLISQVSALTHAASPAGKVAAAVQLGVQGWRDFSNFSQAYLQGGLLKAIAERYATVGIGFSRSHSETITSTALTASMHTGILSIWGNRGAFLQGLEAQIDSVFNIDLPQLILAKSTSSTQTKSSSSGVNVGYNFVCSLPSVSYTQGRSSSEDITHQFTKITMGDQGVINFGKLPYLQLDGAELLTPHATGDIGIMDVFSPQDQHTAHSSGFSVGIGGSSFTGLTGSIGGSYTKSNSRTTSTHAGLFGLTDHDLTIGHLNVTDTLLPEALAALATTVTFTPQHDSQQDHGVSVNLANLRLSSPEDFGKDLGKAVLIGTSSVITAEAARTLGAGDAMASLAGIAMGGSLGYALNDPSPTFGSDPKTYTPSGINSFGEISYNRKGKVTQLVMLDVNQQALQRDVENISHSLNLVGLYLGNGPISSNDTMNIQAQILIAEDPDLHKAVAELDEARADLIAAKRDLELEVERIEKRPRVQRPGGHDSSILFTDTIVTGRYQRSREGLADAYALLYDINSTPAPSTLQSNLILLGQIGDKINEAQMKISAAVAQFENYLHQNPHARKILAYTKSCAHDLYQAGVWLNDIAGESVRTYGAQALRAGYYTTSIIGYGAVGFATGSMAGVIGAIPGAFIGGLAGYSSARIGEMAWDTGLEYAHDQVSVVVEKAYNLGRNPYEQILNYNVVNNSANIGMFLVTTLAPNLRSKSFSQMGAIVAPFPKGYYYADASGRKVSRSTRGSSFLISGSSENSGFYNSLGALDLASVSPKTVIHKNSLQYVGETHLYVILDSSGKILKYGESAAGKTKTGLSRRAEAQARRLKRQNPGEEYKTRIIKEFDSKATARQSETKYIKTHRKVFGQDSLPKNKTNH